MEDKNPKKVIPSVQLGGRPWFLKITHQVLERFSSISGCSLQNFDSELQRYDRMTLLLWLMIAEERPEVTRDKVRAWLQELPVGDAMQLVTQAVGDAVAYSFPTPEDNAPSADADEADGDPTDKDI